MQESWIAEHSEISEAQRREPSKKTFYILVIGQDNFYLYFYLGEYLQWMGTVMKKAQGTLVENQGMHWDSLWYNLNIFV